MAVADENTRIQITISKKLKEKLLAKSQEQNRSMSNYVNTLLQKELKNYKVK